MKKLIAGLMTALMALLTVTSPVLAATSLSSYPDFLATEDHRLDTYIVVGEDASSEDVVGAVNLATRLVEESYDVETVSGETSTDFTGITRDGIEIGSASSGVTLHTAASGETAFPSSSVLKNTHYSKLDDSTFTFNSNNYDYKEQVDVSGVKMRHALAANYINGSSKMVIGTNKDIKYEFVFDEEVTGLGSVNSPNYTYQLEVSLLDETFKIVGVDSDSILMLNGEYCESVDDTSACEYGDYKIYTGLGGSSFVELKIEDADGNTVAENTVTGWDDNSVTKTFSSLDLDVTVTSISALSDGTVVGVDMVVGPTGSTTHDYDADADVDSSSATANEAFPGADRWGIQFSASGNQDDGIIGRGSKIQVVYKPEETQYLEAGEKVTLPNDYADLTFEGFNTDDFATVTIKPQGSTTVYNATDDKNVQSGLYGIELSSDTSGVFKGGGDYYTKAYILFNETDDHNAYPVVIGYYDDNKGHVLINDSWEGTTTKENFGGTSTAIQYGWAILNSEATTNMTERVFSYAFTVNNGEKDFFINVTIAANETDPITLYVDNSSTGSSITIDYENATSWYDTNGDGFDQDFVRLGATANSAQAADFTVTTETSSANAGKKEVDEIVDDSGIIVLNPYSNSGSDRVKFKVPSKMLALEVSFGKEGDTTTSDSTYNKIVSVTSAIAKLDTEMQTLKTTSDVVLVGGPCVNDLVNELADQGDFDYTCDSWPGRDFGIIKVIDDAFADGYEAVVVAGTRAEDTRTACSALQLYDTKLSDVSASSVEVTGSVGSPTISEA